MSFYENVLNTCCNNYAKARPLADLCNFVSLPKVDVNHVYYNYDDGNKTQRHAYCRKKAVIVEPYRGLMA